MKTRSPKHIVAIKRNLLVLVGVLTIIAAVVAAPVYSLRSHAADYPSPQARAARSDAQISPLQLSARWGTVLGTLLPTPPPSSLTIQTFEYNGTACTNNPKTSFNLGETVCAVFSGAPQPAGGRVASQIGWVSPYGSLVQGGDITADPQTGTYQIPSTALQTLTDSGGGTVVVDNRGTWRVGIYSSGDASLIEAASFVVHDPVVPSVDLGTHQSTTQSAVPAGSTGVFEIFANNYGPDAAQTVVLTDTVPQNTTFISFTQTSGPTFNCQTPNSGATGQISCTLASMAAGDSVSFAFTYKVVDGTPGGTIISNTADIASGTLEAVPDDNSTTQQVNVPAGGGGNPDCNLTCPGDVTATANTTDNGQPDGQPGAIVHYTDPSGDSPCGSVSTSHCNDCFFPVGNTIVTATADSGDSCSFSVTVRPSGAPNITCPSGQTANADNDCQATVSVGTATATGDNVTLFATRSDGLPVYTCDANGTNCTRNSSDAPFSAGTTTITWTASSHDTPGPYASAADEEAHRTGSASCTQTVTVNDVTPPNISATDSSASADANCQAAVPDYSSTVSDNCACASSDTSQGCADHSRITYTQTPAAGTLVGLGPHTVHITANDGSSNNNGAGNTSTKDVTFTVNDTTPPTVSCPAPTSASADANCQAPVPDVTSGASASDNCSGAITKTQSPAAGTMVGLGPHTITVTATDASGNQSTCTTTFTVNDTTPPTVSCPAPTTASADANCQAPIPNVVPNVTKSDNCGSVNVTQSPAAGTMVGLGPHTITVTATDGSGNSSNCTTTFTVVDTTGPVITLNGQTPSMWPPNHKYQTFQVTSFVTSVNDNCSGSIPVSSVVITKVTSDELENSGGDGNTLNDIVISSDCKSVQLRSERDGGGNGRVYTIFFSVMDSHGNTGTATAKVVVQHNPGETAVDSGPHYTVMSNCP